MKILVIENDAETAAHVVNGLKEHGHNVDLAATGRDGVFLAVGECYDMLIVDRMLPERDGVTAVKVLCDSEVSVPVLFLTALGGVDDRATGLNTCGVDYLTKPFAFSELLARINALACRPSVGKVESFLRIADLEMDLVHGRVTRSGRTIDLQPQEFRLLEYLMRHAGKVITRTMMLEHVWDFHFAPQSNVVDSHINRLRAKLDTPFEMPLLQTVRGAGYSLQVRQGSE